MDAAHEIAAEQLALWNGPGGHAWVDMQATLDRVLAPYEAMLVDAVVQDSHSAVLDVGCGTGSTTLAIARRLGDKGRAVGIDISEPMLALARTRAQKERVAATFISANAQTYAFELESFDMIVSRFGVMFFDDPVRAFTNLRGAMRKGGALQFITWRSPAENPFMTTAERAAAPLLPNMPPRRPDGPGQFAFADERRVRSILEESGWREIGIEPVDVPCTLPEQDLNLYLTRLGPVGMFLKDADEATRARVSKAVRAAFDPFVHGSEVRFTGACWRLSARQLRT
jgi:ubiquinone/menaquinone biosynthesis C-methylase UbiE